MKALYILLATTGLYLPTFALAQVTPETLRSCLDVEDQTKERLDCYDEKIKPEPKQISAPAKVVQDCRFIKEEDERLNCFNRFVNPLPKQNPAQKKRSLRLAGRLQLPQSNSFPLDALCGTAFIRLKMTLWVINCRAGCWCARRL